MLLISLPLSYEKFVEALLYEWKSLTMEDILTTLNLRELRKRIRGTKEETDDGLYIMGRPHHSDGHIRRDCPINKLSGSIRKGKHDHDSFEDEVSGYLVKQTVRYEPKLSTSVPKKGATNLGNITMSNSYAALDAESDEDVENVYDKSANLLNSSKTGESSSTFTTAAVLLMQMGRVKVIKGCQVMMTRIRKNKFVYTLEAKVMTFGVQKHGDSKQVRFKQLGHGVKTGVHRVQVEKRVLFEVQLWLKDKKLEENTSTDCLVKVQEKLLPSRKPASIGRFGAALAVLKPKRLKVAKHEIPSALEGSWEHVPNHTIIITPIK
nr:hypothetical protein [Tanacetum cinerariifolium]GEY97687.1 hypothetical protein [Tanacetum cinerariifolium]